VAREPEAGRWKPQAAMSNHTSIVPPSLRSAIEADLHPVQPLASPWRRALWLAPIALVLLVISEAIFGLRVDSPDLGVSLTWGASILQMLFGLAVMGFALREAVPGTLLTRRTASLVIATGLVVILAITWTTWASSQTFVPPRVNRMVWLICVFGTFAAALPALFAAAWLVRRAYPLRPALAGALYGLGAGLLSDAGWRLFCHFSDPNHVIGAHMLAVLLSVVAGSGIATLIGRPRR
jgi:hypothetical protein